MAERVTTKEALKKLDEQLECSLCLDTFKQPKLLPCYHVFCKSPCLEKLVAKDGRSLTCPTCRHIVPLSEKGVAGLQSDFHIDRLFEVRDAFDKVSESSDTQCGNCEDGKATGYCQDCGDFLCDECQAAHKKMKRLREHQLVSLNELGAEATNLVLPKKTAPHCPKHPENILKIYCDTCSVLICYDCTVQIHQGHSYDLVANVSSKHKRELTFSLKPIKDKLKIICKALKHLDVKVNNINAQKATLEAKICQEIEQQKKLLDQQKSKLVGELEVLTQQKLNILKPQRDKLESNETRITSCLEDAENGLRSSTECEMLEMKASILDKINQIESSISSDVIETDLEADLRLVANGKEQLEQASQVFLEIEHGGSFSLEHSTTTEDGLKGAITGEYKMVVFQAMTRQRQVYDGKLKLTAKLVHIKSQDTLECSVSKQEKGQHIIKYRSMNRGKHELHLTVNGHPVRGSPFSISVAPSPQSLGKPVRVISCLNKPRGTALNSQGQIVVINKDGNGASVLTARGEIVRSFSSYGSGCGQLYISFMVTVDKDDNIYVADCNNNRIQKFNSKGAFLAVVGSKGNGQLQFNFPVGICYNKTDGNLYIGDQCNHRVQVITTDFQFVRCFGTQGGMPGEFKNVFGLAFDNSNKLYVADHFNNRVTVFTAEGQFLRAFSHKANGQMLHKPWAIAIDSANTVYVSENGPHCVSVFTSHGDYITTFGYCGSEEGQFKTIYGISIDDEGVIIVSDQDNKRLQIF